MCGIFGGIGPSLDEKVLRRLTWANEARGNDSLGYFDATSARYRTIKTPRKALETEKVAKVLEKCIATGLCVGHTRMATRGAVTVKNAHPFRYGKVIGSHNGVVGAPMSYTVDSMYLIDMLNNHRKLRDNPDQWFAKALGQISGYWGLTVYDGEYLYITNYNHQVYVFVTEDGNLYWSSDWRHLDYALGEVESYSIESGDILRVKLVKQSDGTKALELQDYPDCYKGKGYSSSFYGSRYSAWSDTSSGCSGTRYEPPRTKWYTDRDVQRLGNEMVTWDEGSGNQNFMVLNGKDKIYVHYKSEKCGGQWLPGPNNYTVQGLKDFYTGWSWSLVFHAYVKSYGDHGIRYGWPRLVDNKWVWEYMERPVAFELTNKIDKHCGRPVITAGYSKPKDVPDWIVNFYAADGDEQKALPFYDIDYTYDRDTDSYKPSKLEADMINDDGEIVRKKWDNTTQSWQPFTDEELDTWGIAEDENSSFTAVPTASFGDWFIDYSSKPRVLYIHNGEKYVTYDQFCLENEWYLHSLPGRIDFFKVDYRRDRDEALNACFRYKGNLWKYLADETGGYWRWDVDLAYNKSGKFDKATS